MFPGPAQLFHSLGMRLIVSCIAIKSYNYTISTTHYVDILSCSCFANINTITRHAIHTQKIILKKHLSRDNYIQVSLSSMKCHSIHNLAVVVIDYAIHII